MARRPEARRPRPSEDGQSSLLMAGAIVVAAVVLVALVTAGSVVVDGARARTAADAAALAGAAEGEAAARTQAGANGGRLVAYRASGSDVVVTVTVGRAEATARARREGSWCHRAAEGGRGGPISYTDPPCPSIPG